jgi:hypothetical protein
VASSVSRFRPGSQEAPTTLCFRVGKFRDSPAKRNSHIVFNFKLDYVEL